MRTFESRGHAAGVAGMAGLALAVGLAFASALAARQEAPFPHDEHAGLFPVCSGCHQGVDEGDAASTYPAPASCAGCHDGVDRERVAWNGPSERISNVRFDHVEHADELAREGDPAATCESCHSDTTVGRMSVDSGPQLGTCWSCHAHERDDHYEATATSECTVCHVPLAGTRFDLARLEALPTPADHDATDFLLEGHGAAVDGDAARCATCHTAERCVACHVDAGLAQIGTIPVAPDEMEQPAWPPHYPTPPSHELGSFRSAHQPGTGGAAECSTCHTSDDCLSCHIEPIPNVVAQLPSRASAIAPGVNIEVAAPETHQSAFFMSAHSNLAATDPGNCATCHTETYCVACHDGPADGGYHPPSFVARHQADAWGRSSECATCHSTAAFCRECHEASGLGSRGRLEAGYHDAEPLWLIRHGGAARQNLESCASCHQQNDCVQCHGVLGSYQISPHTADFDAEAAWARSPRTCIACHTSNPIGGGR